MNPGMSTDDNLEALRAAARYHRERHDLYLAKTRGPRPTRAGRLRELERARDMAEMRLARAQAARRGESP
jgi:hypothetical protein